GLIIIIVLLFGGYYYNEAVTPGQHDEFAQCIADSGAKFYGAFWCPHCADQKALFGKSEKLLPYIECSTPNGQAQLQICIDEEIKSYPTWEFPDASRISGSIDFEQLAEKTGCALPE
ncbi:MAG: hypothetical protein WD153_00055, partial [Candidatus Paceibacterota bacterium]